MLGWDWMSEKIIRIPRDLYESLPVLYQNIALIGKQTGRVVIVDSHDISELPDNFNWRTGI
jgi:hypothetical protein